MRSRACCCFSHRAALTTGSVLLALVLAMLAGCQGLPANVANCSVTPTPPTNTSVVPPATEPPPAALCAFPLTIATPRNRASVHSPVPIVANAAAPDQITRSGFTWMALRSFTRRPRRSINTSGCRMDNIPWKWLRRMSPGISPRSSIQLNVVAEDVRATDIQNRTNWVSCSALISGSTCAARVGVAQSSLALHQSTPSLDRSASRLSPGGKQAYSNDLYWTPLGGGNSASHFSYDLWFISTTATLRSRWHSM
jgi:hypothetical protein